MVICKIIKIVIKSSVTDTLNQTQHYLQRGFTEGVSPIYAAFLVHELQNEASDLKLPLYVGYLDAKAAFDTVWIGSLMRKLHLDGITSDDWLLINGLHQDATTQVKWCDIITDTFPVNQGVRQGGILSTQEYKRFINPLLQLLESFKIGGCIGGINLSAPTCADDVCVTAHSPADLQVLLDVAGIYSKSEHYSLQPTKCVVVPFRHPESSWNWSILGQPIPLEESTRHIGVQRTSSNSSAGATVKANITKARGAIYSLMSSGLHGKRGLNPCTSIKLWQIYVLPILTYGLELFALNQKLNTELENFQTRDLPSTSITA